MAVDFDALDLVRTENKARLYNTKVRGLTQQKEQLVALAKQMIQELPDDKRWSFEERLKKIENSS
jgi:hypothetical protein